MRPHLLAAGLLLAATAVTATPAFALHADDLQRVRGAYLLEDGRVVRVTGTRRHPRVEFGDGSSQPLEARSATEFLTADGCTRLRFELNDNETLARIQVSAVPDCGSH